MATTISAFTSRSDQFPIHTGMWTNWSRGYILGATLTLNRRDADLLIAFTAFFVSFVATRIWRIICFILHQLYSTTNPQDVVYHQRQAILRNSSSPESGIQMLTQLLWKHRHSRKWIRPLPAALVGTFCVIAFTIAGGFSSQISTALSNEVLIKSMNCGRTDNLGSGSDDGSNSDEVHGATNINSAASYAQQCYSDDSAGIVDCGRYVKSSIPKKKIDRNATCPFRTTMCRNQAENLYIDSGYIDSHNLLGLNAPISERVLFRNVLHCAPLTTNGFTSEQNLSVGPTTAYHYGSTGSFDGAQDYVHVAKSVQSQYSDISSTDFAVGSPNFILEAIGAHVRNGLPFKNDSNFTPSDAIFRKDADTYIFFLSGNGVIFGEPSLDPWYRATTPDIVGFQFVESVKEYSFYIPDEPASPLGCIQQYQFCSLTPQGRRECGPLASRIDAIAEAASLFDSTYDGFTIDVVTTEKAARFLYFASMFNEASIGLSTILRKLGPTSLDSQKKLVGGFQGSIPSNQWQLDVTHWWDVVMASRQWDMLETVYLPQNSDALRYRVNYTDKVYKKLCGNQKIRSTAYASFSVFGLIFTFTVGVLAALTSFLLEPISQALYKKRGCKQQYAHLEWTTNAALHLQRLAHEELGLGTWSEVTETIPITKADELLGPLDISNLEHPTLCRPSNQDSITLHVNSDTETPATYSLGSSAEPEEVTETRPHTPTSDEAIPGGQRSDSDLETPPPAEELGSEVIETSPAVVTDTGSVSEARETAPDSTTAPPGRGAIVGMTLNMY